MNSAIAMSVPGEIKTFPLGDAAIVAVPVEFLNQLLEEIKDLKTQVVSLGGECTTFRQEFGILGARTTVLENCLAGQVNSGEKIALQTPDTVASDTGLSVIGLTAVVEQKIAAQDRDLERLAREAALDRQRVTKLEQKVQPLQKDRGEVLRALIAASGGKVLSKYARLKMHLDKATFSRLLNTLSDYVARKVHQPDRRQKLLVLVDL